MTNDNLPTTRSTAHAEAVKRHARDLGFDACGIASADEPVDPEDHLGDWLARGYHAGMAWMAATREMRSDVRGKLPGARSVVVVARNYFARRPTLETGAGRVSRYAWGRDYHKVLLKPLRRLADAIAAMEPGAKCYASIDSGPVMEKAWAARAGVGWIGKNSLLMRRDLGSWLFLATIVTTVELAADQPVEDFCGACTLCLRACPTAAIVEPRIVDANRCISYHTIENRASVPAGLASRFGDWVFGCDVCQDVCPWNRRAVVTSERDFLPRAGQDALNLDEVSSMDENAFLNRFAGTPLMRAKRSGLQRNAEIVRRNLPHEDRDQTTSA